MFELQDRKVRVVQAMTPLVLLFAIALAFPMCAFGGDQHKKNDKAASSQSKTPKVIDYSYIVWPNPPAIPRIRYLNWYASDKQERDLEGNVQKKSKWMDRLAGTQTKEDVPALPFSLIQPNGLAVDSKGRIYTADQKVGAIFIFDPETKDVELMKHGVSGNFTHIIGLAMDDNDRLFVSDPILRHVMVFNSQHKAEDVISDGMVHPGEMAIDTKNRLLYVSDTELDQVLVYDADSFKLLRKIGTTGHKHELTTPGDLAKPTGLAVDEDGNLYVCDTLNNRIEIFDAEGIFIRAYGKNGDAPPNFARPKGVAIDSDGHIWVADGVQDRVQVFNKDWQLLISFGGYGYLPGQFSGLVNITSDNKRNRIITSEIFPGRVQEFRYITDAEAEQLRKEREQLRAGTGAKPSAAPAPAAAAATPPAELKPLPAPK
jgi:sugar lactone lactonase YvrE